MENDYLAVLEENKKQEDIRFRHYHSVQKKENFQDSVTSSIFSLRRSGHNSNLNINRNKNENPDVKNLEKDIVFLYSIYFNKYIFVLLEIVSPQSYFKIKHRHL